MDKNTSTNTNCQWSDEEKYRGYILNGTQTMDENYNSGGPEVENKYMEEFYKAVGSDGTTDAEKLQYVYHFCKTLEQVLNSFNDSPMAKMMPGMPNMDAFKG